MGIKSVTGKTQANGAFVIDLDDAAGEVLRFYRHQIQIQVSATPTVGTLTVRGKSANVPGTPGPGFVDLGTIDLVAGPRLKLFEGYYTAIELAPTGFDADKTYDAHLTSGER